MSNLVPTNALRNIYVNKPTAPITQSHELDDNLNPLDTRSLDSRGEPRLRASDPGQHTHSDFVLGRSAIIAIIVISIILIVLIVVVVVKAGQIARKNAREKKEKEEAAKAAGIVSGAVRRYMEGCGVAAVLMGVIAQIILL